MNQQASTSGTGQPRPPTKSSPSANNIDSSEETAFPGKYASLKNRRAADFRLKPSGSGRPWFSEPPRVRKSWIPLRFKNRLAQLKNYKWVFFYLGAFPAAYYLNLFIQRVRFGPDHPANNWEWNKMKRAGILAPELLRKEFEYENYAKANMDEDPYESQGGFWDKEGIKDFFTKNWFTLPDRIPGLGWKKSALENLPPETVEK